MTTAAEPVTIPQVLALVLLLGGLAAVAIVTHMTTRPPAAAQIALVDCDAFEHGRVLLIRLEHDNLGHRTGRCGSLTGPERPRK